MLPLGHPERLLPDLPLSPLERELTEELAFLRPEHPASDRSAPHGGPEQVPRMSIARLPKASWFSTVR
ncbi:DUF6059 family protein [Streptomyces sp. N50]|uniref:DUF6059 family protein n=1 Tax=Streptomyces sp. N50 TaxID=3081765 RepID=UPI00398CDDFE